MVVSTSKIIIMIISAVVVFLLPFTTLLFGFKQKGKRVSDFCKGMLAFLVALIVFSLIWNLFNMNGIIKSLLGDDFTVKKIRATIYYMVYTAVECLIFYWIINRMYKKYKVDKPYRAIRIAGGYLFIESLIFVLPYIILPLIVILTNGKTEISFIEEFTLNNVKNVAVFDLLFKVFTRVAQLVAYVTAIFAMFTARANDAKWLYAVSPLVMLGMDLPYQFAATNSRKLSDSSVVEIDIFWKNEWTVVIISSIIILIALIICKVIYNNYYRTAERKAAIKAKRKASTEKIKSLFKKKSEDKDVSEDKKSVREKKKK